MNEQRLKSLFEDLGKPTLRGVRKCPKCGTYNGTRGISCKNKTCDAIFKEMPERRKMVCVDAVKIVTGSSAQQVYSVRVRDRGPDYRGFVQLDGGGNGNDQSPVGDSIAQTTTARCFVETCQKAAGGGGNSQNRDDAATAAASVVLNPCKHVKAAAQCVAEAQPLTLKNSVLNALQLSNEVKHAIWQLATESAGPLVQRVSKNIMVVKCKPNPKHPLGFLHFAFFETTRNREAPEHKFHCSCRAFKNLKMTVAKEDQKRCVHFYACVCAFASNEKLAEEFSYYINMDALGVMADSRLMTVYQIPEQDQSLCEVDLMCDDLPVSPPPVAAPAQQTPTTKKRRRGEVDTLAQASSALLTLQDNPPNSKKQSLVKKVASGGAGTKKPVNILIDETQVSATFHQWLASVTERINQTMHYQFDGSPEPLVFHAPQVFFDCLQQRISAGSKKKRLPNSMTAFLRKDAVPLGTFSKYTWQITNLPQVKQIFDTPEMPLEISRSFVENRDGTYDLYEPPKSENSTEAAFRKTDHQPLIKPFELKTFLKVGNANSEQKDPTPFVIDWIPDILPKMKIGELRIKFEYGHQRNGAVENRTVVVGPQIIQIQSLR